MGIFRSKGDVFPEIPYDTDETKRPYELDEAKFTTIEQVIAEAVLKNTITNDGENFEVETSSDLGMSSLEILTALAMTGYRNRPVPYEVDGKTIRFQATSTDVPSVHTKTPSTFRRFDGSTGIAAE